MTGRRERALELAKGLMRDCMHGPVPVTTVMDIASGLVNSEAELAALKERIRRREAAWRHTKNENLVAASRAASDGNKRVFNRDASDCAIIELELHALLEAPKTNERPTGHNTHPPEDDFGHPV